MFRRVFTRLALVAMPALLLTVPLATPVAAQAKPDDVFAKAFFDPQLVLKHANAIGLTAQQRKAILDEMKATQVALVPLQVDMADPALELQGIIEAGKVDEAKALEAKQQAEEAIKNAKSDLDLAKAQSEFAAMAAQIAAIQKLRKRRH